MGRQRRDGRQILIEIFTQRPPDLIVRGLLLHQKSNNWEIHEEVDGDEEESWKGDEEGGEEEGGGEDDGEVEENELVCGASLLALSHTSLIWD